MAVEDLKTSELLDAIHGEVKEETVTEIVDELMSRFPFDSIGELEKRIDELEVRSQKLLNHIHSPNGTVYMIGE